MADIRQNATTRDDFNRTENPLSQGGNWTRPGVTSYDLKANGTQCVWVTIGQSGHALYQPVTMTGDACETWCARVGGNAAGLAWAVGFYDGTGASANGWLFRSETDTGGGKLRIYKLTAGSFTYVAQETPGVSSPGAMLIRRNGNDIEGWFNDGVASYDDSGGLNLGITYTDTAYQTSMYPVLELFGGGGFPPIHGWDDFGAGGRTNRTQIYRWIKN